MTRVRMTSLGLAGMLRGGVGLAAGAGAAWWVYSRFAVDHALPLPAAIDAERRVVDTLAGAVSVYRDEAEGGPPLVLLHSLNAAASAYEVRPLFDFFRGRRPVFAPDLPGFGFSERGDRAYTPALVRDAITAVLREAAAAEPVDVVAMSATSESAAAAAASAPELVASLALISPTGLGSYGAGPERLLRAGRTRNAQRLLGVPLWSRAIFDALTSRPSIRYYLGKLFSGPPDEGMVEYAYRTAHQPGAQFAAWAFLSGALVTPDVAERVYAAVSAPALILYDRDPYTDFAALEPFCAAHAGWRARRVPGTLGLPHFEALAETVAALQAFWDDVHAPPTRLEPRPPPRLA